MRLSEGVDFYVHRKRDNGIQFDFGETTLRALTRFCDDNMLADITRDDVSRFLSATPLSSVTYRLKHGVLRCFFEYWADRGFVEEFAMPPNRPIEHRFFMPHVYTPDEIKRLLRAARSHPQILTHRSIHPRTFQTIILTMYAMGALGGELSGLRVADVDLQRGRITLGASRSKGDRTIPIGSDLLRVLRRYAAWKVRSGLCSDYFFPRVDGRYSSARRLCGIFKQVRKLAGIVPASMGSCLPRLFDLRCTFAVRRIEAWIKAGTDPNRMLPALAAYLGLVELTSTNRYLFLTPERFRRELDLLSPRKSKRRWRDDPELIRFLHGL